MSNVGGDKRRITLKKHTGPWTDQCKLAMAANAEVYLLQDKRRNLTKTLRRLATESGIPYNTLRRWWYDYQKEKIEHLNRITNDTTQNRSMDASVSNSESNNLKNENAAINVQMPAIEAEKPEIEAPRMCDVCLVKPARVIKRTNGRIEVRTRCAACENKAWPRGKKYQMACPYCRQIVYFNDHDIKKKEKC